MVLFGLKSHFFKKNPILFLSPTPSMAVSYKAMKLSSQKIQINGVKIVTVVTVVTQVCFLRHVCQLVIIWVLSTLISIPECLVLHAVSSLRDQHCVSKDIVWDLTNCIPFWSNKTGLAYGILKTLVLFIVPLLVMIILYTKIINKLWSSDKIEGDTTSNFFLIF